MIVDMKEINEDNISDWSAETLRDMQKTLSNQIENNFGDKTEELLLLRLMSVEIKRQVKIRKVNEEAKKESERAVEVVLNKNHDGNWRSSYKRAIRKSYQRL